MNYAKAAALLPLRHFRKGGWEGLARLVAGVGIRAVGSSYVRGPRRRWCSVCGWEGREFLPYVSWGYVTFRALCPQCGSHERHRGHVQLYEKLDLQRLGKRRLLFVAPEAGVLDYFRRATHFEVFTSNWGRTERAAALREEVADFNFNLLDMSCPDGEWDVIVCHRVIEHLPDDRRGMQELWRVLKPGGLLILSVPIDPSLAESIEHDSPDVLENDHFYRYGMDFERRIPDVFEVERLAFSESFSEEERRRLGLKEDFVFLCRKNDD